MYTFVYMYKSNCCHISQKWDYIQYKMGKNANLQRYCRGRALPQGGPDPTKSAKKLTTTAHFRRREFGEKTLFWPTKWHFWSKITLFSKILLKVPVLTNFRPRCCSELRIFEKNSYFWRKTGFWSKNTTFFRKFWGHSNRAAEK